MEERPAPERSPRCLGPYELRRELGRGAMGIVYEAWHERLDRIVALKVVAAGRLASEDELRRFRTEARAASRLRHPSIVPVHDVGEDGGHHYLVMARIRGPSLAARLKDGPLPPRQAAGIVRRLAAALEYAHGEGVIHRDVKPANVLLDQDGTPLLTDFGLARTHDDESSLTVDGQPIGSPAYMAPEQAAGDADRIGPETDVHALGAVLYALLTGRPPFAAQTAVAALQMVRERPPIAPRTLDPSIPVDLETIATKALRKEPERRYDSARSLADDLDRWLAGVPIRARPVGLLERTLLAARRRPRVAALIVAFVLLAVGATVTVTLSYLTTRSALEQSESDRQLRREDRVSALFAVEADAVPSHLEALLADGDRRVDALLRERLDAADDPRDRFRARLALLARAPESIADEDATLFDAAPDAFERQAAVAVARRAVAGVSGAVAAPFLASVERRVLGSDEAGPRRARDLALGFAFGVGAPEHAEDLDVLAAWLADVDPYELRAYGFLLEPTPIALRRALVRLVRSDDGLRRRQATSLLCRSFATDPSPTLELVGHLDSESLALVADTIATLPEGNALDARLREAVEAPAPRRAGPDPAPAASVLERVESFGGAAGPAAALALSVPPELLRRTLDEVTDLGYRPTRLRPRHVEGALRFSVAWTRDDRRSAWAVDLACGEVTERGRDRPLLPIDVASYRTDDGLRIATLSGPRPPGVVDTALLAGVSMDDYPAAERDLRLRGFVPTRFHFDGGDPANPRFSFVFGLHDESPIPTHVNFALDVDPAADLVPGFSIVDAAIARPDGGPPVGSGLFAPAGPEETRWLAAPDDRTFLERVRPFLDEGFDVRALSVEVDGRGGPVAVLSRPTPTAEQIVARDRRAAEAATLLARRGDLGPALERLADLDRPGARAHLTVLLPASGLPPDGLVAALQEATPPLARALLLTLGRISARTLAPAPRARLRAAAAAFLEHDDPGVRGAAGWALAASGAGPELPADAGADAPNGHRMVALRPDGPFLMGSNRVDPYYGEGEEPHLVRLRGAFEIADCETTFGQLGRFYAERPEFDRGVRGDADHPAERVDWLQAIAYCRWLSDREGIPEEEMCFPSLDELARFVDDEAALLTNLELPDDILDRRGYRLPTEAEWEYAARGGTPGPRWFGYDDRLLGAFATCRASGGRLRRVRTAPPNDHGLFDTIGGVFEWCLGPVYDPRGVPGVVTDRIHELGTTQFVVRGGSYDLSPRRQRVCERLSAEPLRTGPGLGFRVARSLR